MWSGAEGQKLEPVEPAAMAGWGEERLIVKGARFAWVTEVIDRRLRGNVIVVGDALADATVSGSFDLSNPETTLSVLTATQNSKTLSGNPLFTFVYAGD